ncbi:MAG: response regulator [Oscillatoriophycideae cyanobacterium NC_groundwater_1537_Pr4_S-0.65um_50_18]|nr:response regulator [Oscillatoriophycideae cyanobacterium NC_groundwater_1537_Pr4_S-0.65um_50_18]
MISTSQPIRILLVDDTPTNLKVLSESIKSEGWFTLIANDGESAIEQVEYAKPDLILLDVMMPGIDGFEVCRRLKANSETQAIPIIFMTALSDTVDKVRGLELGAVDYITKPFQREEVLARLRVHLKLCHFALALENQAKVLEVQNQRALEEIKKREQVEQILLELKEQLEQRVEERTAELSASLRQLQSAQLQLVQSEKMSALGQLVAGVAHEINNPIGFISGNLQPAQEYIRDLFDLLTLYQQHYPQPPVEIDEKIEDIDLEYVQNDLPKLLASMKEGVIRIGNISNSLRIFSRSDTNQKTALNLHDGLDSTLLILKHRLKGNEFRPEIQVIRKYGDLPIVNCFAGQLNQVFMNILANAIDALDEVSLKRSLEEIKLYPNQIQVATELSATQKAAIIRIQDNGLGIPDTLKEHIFDHLYTTKPVGKGTGLGLSISRQIIEETHGGKLTCISIPGEKTEFVIEIPL